MNEADNGSEKGRRKIVLQVPATAAAFARETGLRLEEVIDALRTMGIHARPNSVMPKEVFQALGTKHNVDVEFTPPPRI